MEDFSLSEAVDVLMPLAGFVLGILVYAIFIFRFYRFLAKRDIIGIDLSCSPNLVRRFGRVVLYVFQYLFLVPLLIFFWYGMMVVLLSFLGKENSAEGILLICIALVSSVRVTSYYSEDLSRDLAKMLPFAVLGLFIADQSYFELSLTSEILRNIPDHWETVVYYLMFTIALEFMLRIVYTIRLLMRPNSGLKPNG